MCNAYNLRMDTGNFADYAFGSGTEAITFLYTVQEGDNSPAFDAWDAPANGELSVHHALRFRLSIADGFAPKARVHVFTHRLRRGGLLACLPQRKC